MSKHTPTPWKKRTDHSLWIPGSPAVHIPTKFNGEITQESRERCAANVNFILKAVNMHDELVKALDIAVFELEQGIQNLTDIDTFKALIARAKGEK